MRKQYEKPSIEKLSFAIQDAMAVGEDVDIGGGTLGSVTESGGTSEPFSFSDKGAFQIIPN